MTNCVIEEASAVEQIDAIAARPGVGMLFIGTSDLSFSLAGPVAIAAPIYSWSRRASNSRLSKGSGPAPGTSMLVRSRRTRSPLT
jgi:hypothetical protein